MADNTPDESNEGGSRRGALVALLIVVALVVGGILISQSLSSSNRIQDCVMAGRSNCAPINTTK